MATEPNWTPFKYTDFKGGTSHTKRVPQFIDHFVSGEQFLTSYGLVNAKKIKFTRQSGTSETYTISQAKNGNGKVKQHMIAEWNIISNEKKPRAIEVESQLPGSNKSWWFPITFFLKTEAFGGKKGSKLNKGTQFEKDFYAESLKVLQGITKGNGYMPTILAMNEEFEKRMSAGMSGMEAHGGKFVGVLEEGSANKSRPIEKSGSGFVVSAEGTQTEDMGSTLTDITFQYGQNKDPVYLSLKYGPTLTFFNAGVGDYFPKQQVQDRNITSKDGLDLLKMFDIDMLDFCKAFSPRTQPMQNHKRLALNADTGAIQKLLRSGIGYGYWMVHNTKGYTVDWYEMDKQYMVSASTIIGPVTIFYGRMNGNGIGVNMTCESSKYTFIFNIRNKQASGPWPTHIMCDYRKKKDGKPNERPENGTV